MLPMAVARSSSGGVTQSQGCRGNFWGFLPIDNTLYGPYSGMNFATKDRFRLNLFFTVKWDNIQFPIIKRHHYD